MDDVSLYGAERFVSDHYEDLLFLLQVDEVTEPRLLSQSAGRTRTTRLKTDSISIQKRLI